jgi:hypothetical protein
VQRPGVAHAEHVVRSGGLDAYAVHLVDEQQRDPVARGRPGVHRALRLAEPGDRRADDVRLEADVAVPERAVALRGREAEGVGKPRVPRGRSAEQPPEYAVAPEHRARARREALISAVGADAVAPPRLDDEGR